MAYNDLTDLKLFLVEAWRPLMPICPVLGARVPVDYAWPGPQQKATHVWMPNNRTTSEPYSMRAGRKRRQQSVQFDVVIESTMIGKTIDELGRNVLQHKADRIVGEIAGVIDEWIADHPNLDQTTPGSLPVDYATFASFNSEGGPTTNGVRTVGICQISYIIRPL